MEAKISDKKLRSIVKDSLREVLKSEIMELRALAVPNISDKEQKEIEESHGKPSGRQGKSYPLNI